MSRAKEDEERLRYHIDYCQQGPADSGYPSFQIFNESLRRAPSDQTLFDRAI
jgi:hypothetical protein